MRTATNRAAVFLVLATGLLAAACPKQGTKSFILPSNPLTLTITAKDSPSTALFRAGERIQVLCTFTNTGSGTREILLPQSDTGLPGFLLARVWALDGRLLTENDLDPDGWFSSIMLWSATYTERPGDRIPIEPGAERTIRVNLDRLLLGCPAIPEGLPPGSYGVQFKAEDLESNELILHVQREE